MSRRLMFLHYKLNEKTDSLINKFLHTQIDNPTKNAWIHTVREDLEKLEIGLDLETIRDLSRESFERFVDKKLENLALDYQKKI